MAKSYLSLLCLLFVLTWNKVSGERCPVGWHFHKSKCYDLETFQLDWLSAEKSCREGKGNLAATTNHGENGIIADLIRFSLRDIGPEAHRGSIMHMFRMGVPEDEYEHCFMNWKKGFKRCLQDKVADYEFWIGLNDLGNEGNYKWMSSGKRANFTSWDKDEPNDHSSVENCVVTRKSGKWNDLRCNYKRYFVCERPTIQNDNCFNYNPCLNGGTCVDTVDNCICLCNPGYVGKNCETEGSGKFDNCFPDPCLNGGTCIEENDNYKCSCGPEFFGSNCEKLNNCYPNPCQNNGTCTDGDNDYTCSCPSISMGENCKETCPAGWTRISKSCFKFNSNSSEWFSAQSSCSEDGGYLVDIKSDEENKIVVKFRNSIDETDIWIGLRGTHNTYMWISGSVFSFTNWASDQPSDPISDESCVEMWQSGMWNDLACITKRPYVCERSVIESCPAGWTLTSNNCYRFSASTSDWFWAQYSCRKDGGNLVVINSPEKNEVVDRFRYSINNQGIWIGLKKINPAYMWVSGSVFNFTNWESRQSDLTSAETCVEMWRSATWSDLGCRTRRHYVCERSVIA